MTTNFKSLLLTEDGDWDEDALRSLDEEAIVEWIYARVVDQDDGFGPPGDRWNYEHPADLFFHLAGKLQESRDYYAINYPEFLGILYGAAAKFLKECDKEEVGYRNAAALCGQLASTAHVDSGIAQELVEEYRDLVLSEKFSWWGTDKLKMTMGIIQRSTDTEIELNIQDMLHGVVIQLQAQTGERGYDPELVRHFGKYEARIKTYSKAFTGKLAFCGSVPVVEWLDCHKPFWHFYRVYTHEPDNWTPRLFFRHIRQAYSFPYESGRPHEKAVKCLAYELKKHYVHELRRGWRAEDIWREIRGGLELDLDIYNSLRRRGQRSLTSDEFWPMPENLEDVQAF